MPTCTSFEVPTVWKFAIPHIDRSLGLRIFFDFLLFTLLIESFDLFERVRVSKNELLVHRDQGEQAHSQSQETHDSP